MLLQLLYFVLPWSDFATVCKGVSVDKLNTTLGVFVACCSKSLCLDRRTKTRTLDDHIVLILIIVLTQCSACQRKIKPAS